MNTPKLLTLATVILLSCEISAQNGDCPGEPVCTPQTENMSAGVVNEITPANRGCLGAAEATSSYWYQLCAATSGTISFTINPQGAGNDYDFAIWGPGAACPPTTAPIRCSYAATPVGGGPNGDITGLGNGAVDLSEGAGGNSWVAPLTVTAGQCFVVNINNYAGGSSTFDIVFGGTATLDCSILPVELFSFIATATESGVKLNWSCHSETNNSHFIVERTLDGINYEFLTRVEGAGTSTQPTMYEYIDVTAPAGTSYYRLRQVDYDGRETMYGPLSCEMNGVGPAVMEVFNMSGQVMFCGETTNYVETINQQNFVEGMYVITLTRGTSTTTFKHVVGIEMKTN
jgi:hypothetical protein